MEEIDLKLDEYIYQRWGEDDNVWTNLETESDYDRMVRMLSSAYISVSAILTAMHEGLPARTLFAAYRAIPIDGTQS